MCRWNKGRWDEAELCPPLSQPFFSLFPPSHSPHTLCLTCGKTPHSQTCSSGPGLPAASSPTLRGHSSLFPPDPAHFKVPQCVFFFFFCRPSRTQPLSLSLTSLPCLFVCVFFPSLFLVWSNVLLAAGLSDWDWWSASVWCGSCALRVASGSKWLTESDPLRYIKLTLALRLPLHLLLPPFLLSLDERLILSHKRALSGLPAAFRAILFSFGFVRKNGFYAHIND